MKLTDVEIKQSKAKDYKLSDRRGNLHPHVFLS